LGLIFGMHEGGDRTAKNLGMANSYEERPLMVSQTDRPEDNRNDLDYDREQVSLLPAVYVDSWFTRTCVAICALLCPKICMEKIVTGSHL